MALKPYVPELLQLPMGDLKVKIKSIQEITNKFAAPEDPSHKQKRFEWRLVGDEDDGECSFWTGTALSEKSNLMSWVEAVLGKKLTKDQMEALDLEDLVGKELMVRIESKEDDRGNSWARVVKWWPVGK